MSWNIQQTGTPDEVNAAAQQSAYLPQPIKDAITSITTKAKQDNPTGLVHLSTHGHVNDDVTDVWSGVTQFIFHRQW